MSGNPAEGARAKLHRAKEHLDQLNSEILADGEKDLYGFSLHDDCEGRECVVTYRMPRKLSVRYAILAGEVVGQIRSAFDHIIWRLVPAPNPGSTGLPVVLEETKYEKARQRMIDGINHDAAAIIEGVQPFKNGGANSELYVLNELWNRDKHRLLNLIAVVTNSVQRHYLSLGEPTRRFIDDALQGDLEDGAEFLRISHPDFYNSSEMEVRIGVDFTIKFRDAGPASGQSAAELLGSLLEFGKSLVDSLARTIKS